MSLESVVFLSFVFLPRKALTNEALCGASKTVRS